MSKIMTMRQAITEYFDDWHNFGNLSDMQKDMLFQMRKTCIKNCDNGAKSAFMHWLPMIPIQSRLQDKNLFIDVTNEDSELHAVFEWVKAYEMGRRIQIKVSLPYPAWQRMAVKYTVSEYTPESDWKVLHITDSYSRVFRELNQIEKG